MESVDGLDIKPCGIYVDVTFGGGGHSREILRRLGKDGRLLVFDQDEEAMANVPNDERVTFIHSNFKYLYLNLKYELDRLGLLVDMEPKVDGIIADLGVSFHDFDTAERGFSFRYDSMIDMRMNQKQRLTAAMVLNEYTEERLRNVFYTYGEVKDANRIAKKIVVKRRDEEIMTVGQLLNSIGTQYVEEEGELIIRGNDKKNLARIFQALRIEVNGEMVALSEMLSQTTSLIKTGGRLSVITYHSLEDRMVKNFIRNGKVIGEAQRDDFGNKNSTFIEVNRKPIVASDDEILRNPRSRSAKLRIGERTELKG